MYAKKLLILFVCCLCLYTGHAQITGKVSEADAHSLTLFNEGKWKVLVIYGKETITSGIDFPLLRMRTGYAAYMLGNFSESLLQYNTVYEADPENKTALYYVYLNNLYLNNTTAARYYAGLLPAETKEKESLQNTKISSFQAEFSYKSPDDTARRNAQYARIGFTTELGYRFQLQQSLAYYTLEVNTPLSSTNRVLYQRLQQPEYYAKLTYTATGNISIIGAYHFLSDKFPNSTLNTHVFLGGVKYSHPYFSIQANASTGNFNTNYSQFDGILTFYPLGNLNVYSMSRISFGTQTNFTQVLGAKLMKGVWLEGNSTFGTQNYLFDNDALYVKNDADPNLFKGGGSLYTLLSPKCMLSINYTLEQRQKLNNNPTNIFIPNTNYFQHSINGGLTWKF